LFRHWLCACSVLFVGIVLALGTYGFHKLGKPPWDAFYSAVQVFGLNYDKGEFAKDEIDWTLQVARFLAPGVLIAAVVKLLADGFWSWLRRVWHTRSTNHPRDVVIGFGPLGREIGRRLLEQGRAVTWIDHVAGDDEALRDAREAAERFGGVLVTGDPSDERQLRAAALNRAQRAFVALGDDLASFDAAEAIRAHATRPIDIRIFTESPVIAGSLPMAAQFGFVTGRGVELFNIRAEAVRRLVKTVQWDRLAGIVGQDRVHLVIAGLGWQGEALMEETLLLCNRVGLKPPLVTVIDRDARSARARVLRRSPALLSPDLNVPNWLPPRFVESDLETVDFAGLDLRETCDQQAVAVTAWAICTGNDDLNLRASLQLQTAIQTRRLEGAPIHIRIWAGHASDSHSLGTDGLTMSVAFGGLSAGLDHTSALMSDPDQSSKTLHDAYLEAKRASPGLKQDQVTVPEKPVSRERQKERWEDLSPSMKNSNRRANRHAAMKLADLGYDWKRWESGQLPVLSDDQKKGWHRAQAALAEVGFNTPALSMPDGVEEKIAARFLKVMKVEHDRWTMDRAIDGWRWAKKRDDSRLLHPSMTDWSKLDKTTRAYDAVQVRTFVDRPKTADRPDAVEWNCVCVDLNRETGLFSNALLTGWPTATELQILLPAGNIERPDKTEFTSENEKLQKALLGKLRKLANGENLCRVFLIFPAPPAVPVLALANDLARAVQVKGVYVNPVWAWRQGPHRSVRLPEGLKFAEHDVAAELLKSTGQSPQRPKPPDGEIWASLFLGARGNGN